MITARALKNDLKKSSDPIKVSFLQKYFKTRKGEYGEGDIFLGIPVPQIRRIAQHYEGLPLVDLQQLITSKIHEHRSACLEILLLKYKKADQKTKKDIVSFYFKNIKSINNWDLVDMSAPGIIGDYLINKPRAILYKLAKSKNLWERRIAIMATYQFIKNNKFNDALRIARDLLTDSHDLIHKAVGWMLREVGNRSLETEERFLKEFHKTMPRTMLRYAIEHFSIKKRREYLN